MTTAVKTAILIALALSANGAETTDGTGDNYRTQKTAVMKTGIQSRESSNTNYEAWKNELYLSPLSKAILNEF